MSGNGFSFWGTSASGRSCYWSFTPGPHRRTSVSRTPWAVALKWKFLAPIMDHAQIRDDILRILRCSIYIRRECSDKTKSSKQLSSLNTLSHSTVTLCYFWPIESLDCYSCVLTSPKSSPPLENVYCWVRYTRDSSCAVDNNSDLDNDRNDIYTKTEMIMLYTAYKI